MRQLHAVAEPASQEQYGSPSEDAPSSLGGPLRYSPGFPAPRGPAPPLQPVAASAAEGAAPALALAAPSVSVEGTVQRITFRAEGTAYTVLRLQLAAGSEVEGAAAAEAAAAGSQRRARGKKRVITVVGNLPQASGEEGELAGRGASEGLACAHACPGARPASAPPLWLRPRCTQAPTMSCLSCRR